VKKEKNVKKRNKKFKKLEVRWEVKTRPILSPRFRSSQVGTFGYKRNLQESVLDTKHFRERFSYLETI